MDEVIFRASETFDNLQFKLGLAADEGKNALISTSGKVSNLVVQFINNSRVVNIKDEIYKCYLVILTSIDSVQDFIVETFHPGILLHKISLLFHGRFSRDLTIFAGGVVLGIFIGYYVAAHTSSSKYEAYRRMPAVQCLRYSGDDAAVLLEDARGPKKCRSNEVLIHVKACSLNSIDYEICKGYGSSIRKHLIKYFTYCQGELPITLGRDCAGIVCDIGSSVTKFDIGDEVWGISPFWAPGTMSEYAALPEQLVARKPYVLGFESATSIPYCGSLALKVLDDAQLSLLNAEGRPIFIHGGCSAVGCILAQILIYWGAKVTVSCFERAVPVAKALGVEDIIVLSSHRSEDMKTKSNNKNMLVKELEVRHKFDAILVTTPCDIRSKELRKFINETGAIISTIPRPPVSDSNGFITGAIFSLHVKIKSFYQRYFSNQLKDYGEPHICHVTLDKLSQYVENGQIQTVVDRVYQPHEIDEGFNHIKSIESIGSTVITFR